MENPGSRKMLMEMKKKDDNSFSFKIIATYVVLTMMCAVRDRMHLTQDRFNGKSRFSKDADGNEKKTITVFHFK